MTYFALRMHGYAISPMITFYVSLAVLGIGAPLALVLNAIYSFSSPRVGIVLVASSFTLSVPLKSLLQDIDWPAVFAPQLDAQWNGPIAILCVWALGLLMFVIGVYGVGLAVQPMGRPKLPPSHSSEVVQ